MEKLLDSIPRLKNADWSRIRTVGQPREGNLRVSLHIQRFRMTSRGFTGSGPSLHDKAASALGNITSSGSLDFHALKSSGCCAADPIVWHDYMTASIRVIFLSRWPSCMGNACNECDICAMYAESEAVEPNSPGEMLESRCSRLV